MNDDTKLYRLVFTGNLLPGHSKNKVVARLQKMLHLNREKAKRLVSGKHKQINKKLTLDRAERLRLLVLKQGAECVLLPIEDSFVSTQQLPMFIREDENNLDAKSKAERSKAEIKDNISNLHQGESQQSISNIRNRSLTVSRNSKLKYLFYAVFIMTVEAIVIWNIKPSSLPCDCLNDKKNIVTGELGIVQTESQKPAMQLVAIESETEKKLKSLSVRASLWFAEKGEKTIPADVSWIWIKGDSGITVREMNDSWGNAIRYFGNKDGFELRSAGPDKIFYTDDDVFRKTIL
jgi:hypothetical protein